MKTLTKINYQILASLRWRATGEAPCRVCKHIVPNCRWFHYQCFLNEGINLFPHYEPINDPKRSARKS